MRALIWLGVVLISWAFAAWLSWSAIFEAQPTHSIKYQIYGPPSGHTHKDPINGNINEDSSASIDKISFLDRNSQPSAINIKAHANSLYLKIADLVDEHACAVIRTTPEPRINVAVHKLEDQIHDLSIFLIKIVAENTSTVPIDVTCQTNITASTQRFATKSISFDGGFSRRDSDDKSGFDASYIRLFPNAYCVGASYSLENVRAVSSTTVDSATPEYGNQSCFSSKGLATIVWNSPVAANWRELTLILVGVLFSIGSSALVECFRPMIESIKSRVSKPI
jgi:hypothetical protein